LLFYIGKARLTGLTVAEDKVLMNVLFYSISNMYKI